MTIKHFDKVDLSRIQATFRSGRQHRAKLHIPFLERAGTRTLCVIGQNPSAADEQQADKTVRFLERYVFEKLPQYSQMLMLNLYSRVDAKKTATTGLNHSGCEKLFHEAIAQHEDFLVVFGKLRNQGAYKFPERARSLKLLLAGKHIYRLGLPVNFAPHPGNRAILYNNTDIGLVKYDLAEDNGVLQKLPKGDKGTHIR